MCQPIIGIGCLKTAKYLNQFYLVNQKGWETYQTRKEKLSCVEFRVAKLTWKKALTISRWRIQIINSVVNADYIWLYSIETHRVARSMVFTNKHYLLHASNPKELCALFSSDKKAQLFQFSPFYHTIQAIDDVWMLLNEKFTYSLFYLGEIQTISIGISRCNSE